MRFGAPGCKPRCGVCRVLRRRLRGRCTQARAQQTAVVSRQCKAAWPTASKSTAGKASRTSSCVRRAGTRAQWCLVGCCPRTCSRSPLLRSDAYTRDDLLGGADGEFAVVGIDGASVPCFRMDVEVRDLRQTLGPVGCCARVRATCAARRAQPHLRRAAPGLRVPARRVASPGRPVVRLRRRAVPIPPTAQKRARLAACGEPLPAVRALEIRETAALRDLLPRQRGLPHGCQRGGLCTPAAWHQLFLLRLFRKRPVGWQPGDARRARGGRSRHRRALSAASGPHVQHRHLGVRATCVCVRAFVRFFACLLRH